MIAHRVTETWLLNRQQVAMLMQRWPACLKPAVGARAEQDGGGDRGFHMPIGDGRDDTAIEVDKRDDFVPRRPAAPAGSAEPVEASGEAGIWTSHEFWKGMVFGVLAVVLVKVILEVQAPFGIDWYSP